LETWQKIPTVVLDPYLLISMSAVLSPGTLLACPHARFAVCEHMTPGDFLPQEYKRLIQAINREHMEMLSVPAIEIADLLPMRTALVLNQIATIAAARFHGCMFASDCRIFRHKATTVLEPNYILCGRAVRQRFKLN
jgi:hypothetical protein